MGLPCLCGGDVRKKRGQVSICMGGRRGESEDLLWRLRLDWPREGLWPREREWTLFADSGRLRAGHFWSLCRHLRWPGAKKGSGVWPWERKAKARRSLSAPRAFLSPPKDTYTLRASQQRWLCVVKQNKSQAESTRSFPRLLLMLTSHADSRKTPLSSLHFPTHFSSNSSLIVNKKWAKVRTRRVSG